MTKEEFIEKYRDVSVTFYECYKYTMTYKNKELGIVVSGTIDYRDLLNYTETVGEIYQLDNFNFLLL